MKYCLTAFILFLLFVHLSCKQATKTVLSEKQAIVSNKATTGNSTSTNLKVISSTNTNTNKSTSTNININTKTNTSTNANTKSNTTNISTNTNKSTNATTTSNTKPSTTTKLPVVTSTPPVSTSKTQAKTCSANCMECSGGICAKCPKAFFSFENTCVMSCPDSTFADNYSLSCKKAETNPVFIKAYTFSRCMNKCGEVFSDCSCHPKCRQTGACCSDYKYCNYINEAISLKKQCPIRNCVACSSDQKYCLMCNKGSYYFENKCLDECPIDTTLFRKNSICVKQPTCGVENCEHCEGAMCVKCQHGLFLHENECTPTCPLGTRANRINFSCVNKSTFAFFMIFPSVNSCKGKCGVNDSQSDCSCHHHCLKDGNCCDDFDAECKGEIKLEKCKACNKCVDGVCLSCQEDAELVKGDCNCMNGYYYSIVKDKCERNDKKSELKGSEYLGKMLIESFVSRGKTEFDAIREIRPYVSGNVIFNGNISMNIYSDNENLSIINENVLNENSFNNSTKIEKNINSKNIVIRTSGSLPKIIPQMHLNNAEQENPIHNGHIDDIGTKKEEAENKKGKEQNEDGDSIPPERKESIVINKHFHLNHAKYFPKDLDHEEGKLAKKVNKTKKSTNQTKKIKNEEKKKSKNKPKTTTTKTKSASKPPENENTLDVSPKILEAKIPEEDNASPSEEKDSYSKKYQDTKSLSDIHKKIHVSIHIPGTETQEGSTKNTVTVHNKYFINDKSMTLNKPKNPNVFNFYNNDCKNGSCVNNGNFLSKGKYISDKDFEDKAQNKTITVEQNGVLVVNRNDSEEFLVPSKEKESMLAEMKK